MGKQDSSLRLVKKMKDDKKAIERFTLLPNRYYIILEKVDEEQFTLSAYDTTKSHNPDGVPCAASVVQEGLLEIMDIDLSSVLKMGALRIKNRDFIPPEDNVIKVDFGAKQ